jgi:hypothetical protein
VYFRPTPKTLGSVIPFIIFFFAARVQYKNRLPLSTCPSHSPPNIDLLLVLQLIILSIVVSYFPPLLTYTFLICLFFLFLFLPLISFSTLIMDSPRPRAEVIFSSDVQNMDDWARRTRIPLTTAEALGATYARAHRWLQTLKVQLIREHNWRDVPSSDSRMLFSLETSSIWRSSVGLPAGPQLKLQLPVHASSFFSPERRVQWQMVFHSDIFESVRKICPPINDILSLIQCLLTGVVTLVFEEHLPNGVYRTSRGLPPVSWVNANESALTEIFGIEHYRALRRACSDTQTAFKLEVVPRPR